MEGSWEYVEQAVTGSRKGGVLQLGDWMGVIRAPQRYTGLRGEGCRRHRTKTSSSMGDEKLLNQLSDYQLIKKDTLLCGTSKFIFFQ
jgi:hypothetical protein